VIINSPFNASGDPNPNLYYLSCPHLRLELARLEDAGSIAGLQRSVGDDPDLKLSLEIAQVAHDHEWRRAADQRAGSVGGARVNIAGSKKTTHLKCLHAHFAYFLTHEDYTIGLRIAEILGNTWCDDEMCAKWKE
jgi:hypothetical protein